MDAYAGVSRGTEQWTVRGSRELGRGRRHRRSGRSRYEVLEPMRRIRFASDANDVQPVSFEWIFEGAVPAVLENHEVHRARDGRRVDADIARYHHIGTARGWVAVDGERVEFDRRHVGIDAGSLVGRPLPVGVPPDRRSRAAPVPTQRGHHDHLVTDPHDRAPTARTTDSTRTTSVTPFGDWQRIELQGGFEHPTAARGVSPCSNPSSTSTR